MDEFNPPQWLGEPNNALAAITTVHAWRLLPFATVIMIAGLASIPKEVDDAAKVDGATGLRKLWYVTLPLQLPIALIAVLFGIVFTATDMAVVYILTRGGPFNSTQMLPMWAFQTGIQAGALGAGRGRRALPAARARARHGADAALRAPGGGHVMCTRRSRDNFSTYLVVGPFAIVLAFPFYWMLRTSLKTEQDLYNIQNVPFGFGDGSPTLRQLPLPLRGDPVPALAREHGARRARRRRDHAR